MSRKPAIHDAEPSLVVSHGADFFGEDRHPLKGITALAPYAESSVSFVDRPTIAPLVRILEAPASRSFPAAEAAQLSEQLLKVARNRHTKSAVALLARAMADAAARAAAGGEAWTWTVEGSTAAAAA
ncbi:hypothetical protein OG413_46700 [Streptomyces sp. NBC_01433]|uniref:DUF7739 domain-containing protein n=1 Tax=Streptomyces sp. NBC_01433 TaxID=2903864 RepID=UPI00225AA092|nr:hypothetical protein [Streptomyces sp. NBC_01433]MCX4682639.1 hypothetical protein [Streptomyces sp. NBC_01433]MCX4682679.1 hypothetical protein [Streptomyces sp. NBC_01433]